MIWLLLAASDLSQVQDQISPLAEYGPLGVTIAGMITIVNLMLKGQKDLASAIREQAVRAEAQSKTRDVSAERIADQCHQSQVASTGAMLQVAEVMAALKTSIENGHAAQSAVIEKAVCQGVTSALEGLPRHPRKAS